MVTSNSLAEYLRVHFADDGLIPIPSVNYTDPTTNGTISLLNDYVMLSDIFATGWTALEFPGWNQATRWPSLVPDPLG
jgi:hypothetical protein